MKTRFIAVGVALVSSFVSPAFAQQSPAATGTISGTVVNESSQPVSGAKVHFLLTDPPPPAHFVRRYVESDEYGHFKIDHLDWGTYRVFAGKEDEGYPDTFISLYDNSNISECHLNADAPTATTVLSIGPKAGSIVGNIFDAITGVPVQNGTVRIWRWNDSANWLKMATVSPYRMLVPANWPVGVEVSAPGYASWQYTGSGSSSGARPLVLKSGETLRIDVRLRPQARD